MSSLWNKKKEEEDCFTVQQMLLLFKPEGILFFSPKRYKTSERLQSSLIT